jgi:outer membrane receptor protein involved in Fe transport
VRYVGDRADRDFGKFPSPRVTLPSYIVLDLAGEAVILRTTPGLSLTVRLENALNRQYVEVANFPARGRTVMLGGKVGL